MYVTVILYLHVDLIIISGDHICMSCYEGNFKESCLNTSTHLVMLAAGTGFTPMVKLIYKSLVQDTQSQRLVLPFTSFTSNSTMSFWVIIVDH
jgi:ferredoxin-NADP reductase